MDLFQKSFSTNMAWCESTQVSGERQPRLRLGWRRALLSPKSLHPCAAHHRAARHRAAHHRAAHHRAAHYCAAHHRAAHPRAAHHPPKTSSGLAPLFSR